MSWSSGLGLLDDVWECLEEYLTEEQKCKVAIKFKDLFESLDCDCVNETDMFHQLKTNLDFIVPYLKDYVVNRDYDEEYIIDLMYCCGIDREYYIPILKKLFKNVKKVETNKLIDKVLEEID